MTFFRDRPELLVGFREGSRAVLEAVYWEYVGRVERIVRYGFRRAAGERMSGVPPGDVPDLVQEVFARVFRESTRRAFDGARELAPYVATIARNVVTDWARKRGHVIVEVEANLDDLPQEEVDEVWADDAVVRVTEGYLAHLAPDLARVHEQRYVLGLSQTDAANALGVTRQNLRTLEGRLRQGLKKALRKANLGWDS